MKVQAKLTDKQKAFFKGAYGKPLSVDTETNGKDIRDGRGFAMGLSIAYKEGAEFRKAYFPFRHKFGQNLEKDVLAVCKIVIEKAPWIVFHNAKFDLTSLRTLGIDYKGMWYCTMIMAHLINENWPATKSLEAVTKYYVGPEYGKEMSDELKAVIKYDWAAVPAEMMTAYGETDAELPYRILEKIKPAFEAEVAPEFWNYKRRFIEVITVMEGRGILIDQEYCKEKMDEAEQYMFDYMDLCGGFNPASFKDMNELMCVRLGLPPIMREKVKKNKDGTKETTIKQTFDMEAMQEYELMLQNREDLKDAELASYVLGYRGWQKASSAFYRAYLEHVSPDGRLRPTYHHHRDDSEGGTVTGRLSCSKPNLQQIPRMSEDSKPKPWSDGVKSAFKPTPGYALYEVDYSQLELRLGTAYSKEASLIKVFEEGRDIFEEMSGSISQTRQHTKTFVYMTQYGSGTARISRIMGVLETLAKEMKDTYYRTYPGFRRINDMVRRQVEKTKKIRIWSGRYRHFRSTKDAYKAWNSLIQGGSADIVERQMIRVFDEVDQKSNDEVRMLLTVHDSVWFEIKIGTEDHWLPQIVTIMEDVNHLEDFNGVRFAVEAKKLGD